MTNLWPDEGYSHTVGQMRDYLGEQGLDNSNFWIAIRTNEGGPLEMQGLEIAIDGTTVANADEKLTVPNNTTWFFDPQLNLARNDREALMLIGFMVHEDHVDNWHSAPLAASPEPVSMAFLGTGPIGMILIRRKRRA